MANHIMKDYGEGLSFPYCEDMSALGRNVDIKGEGITLKNSISAHPMEGADALPDGSPGELTFRKYKRFAASGVSLIWMESLAVGEDGRSNANALMPTESNVDSFKMLVDAIKTIAPDVPVIGQLTHSGRFSKPHGKPEPVIACFNPHYDTRVSIAPDYPLVDDDYLDRLLDRFVASASICHEAGFDGVDVKACHGYLVDELLSAFMRPGRYGGTYENRTRFLRDAISAIKGTFGSDLIVASRYAFSDNIPFPFGFGMSRENPFEYDLTEPIRLLKDMNALGVNLVNMSVGTPMLNIDYFGKPIVGLEEEGALVRFNRFYSGTKAMHEACPDVTIIGSDFSALRGEAPHIAAGCIESDSVSMAGFGRMSLSYEGFARDMISGDFDPKRSCSNCGACSKLLRAGVPCGCPIHDKEVYLPIYNALSSKA